MRTAFAGNRKHGIEAQVYMTDLSHIPPRHRAMIIETARSHHVDVADMLGPKHIRRFYRPRQAAMKAIRALPKPPSYVLIGRWFGGRNHATVINAVKSEQR
jgi:chromosomal replication initiation ATPase DnaA